MSSFTHIYGIDVSKDTLDILNLDSTTLSKEKVQIKNLALCLRNNIRNCIQGSSMKTSIC